METPQTHTSRPVTILIVEDSATQAEQLRNVLEGRGYAVRVARDGQQALAALRENAPTVVVSDVIMPGMDGYALCHAIKSDPALRDIPVVLVTTLTSPEDVVRGLECGADNFIRKPYDEDYLLSRIQHIVTNCELRAHERAQEGVGFQVGVSVQFGGRRYVITSERQQILDLLISTYEQAVRVNEELSESWQALRRSYQSLSALYRLAVDLNGARSESAVVEAVLQRALELPGVRAAWVFLRDGAGFRCAGTRGLPPELARGGALAGDCDCHRQLLAGDLGLGPGIHVIDCERLAAADGTKGLRRHAVLPVQDGEKPTGLVNLILADEVLSDDVTTLLQGLGGQFATALERVRLHEHLERRVAERMAALQQEIAERERADAEVRRLNAELEQRVAARTAELAEANRELEAFTYSVSHDLRAPLRAVAGFGEVLLGEYAGRLDGEGRECLERMLAAAKRMGDLIDDLLRVARVTRQELDRQPVDLSALARAVAAELQKREPHRKVHFVIGDGIRVTGDAPLLRVLLENLFGNAWKYTGKHATARIEFGQVSGASHEGSDGLGPAPDTRYLGPVFFVRDDGAGFDMAYADRLFAPFQRLHAAGEFEGTGIGLATARRIVNRHGGRIWAESAVERGATFYFTLSAAVEATTDRISHPRAFGPSNPCPQPETRRNG